MTELTQPFTLTRLQVALASAEEYVRALWWILIPVPIFGVLALLQAPNDLIRGIGTICLVWPLTIPIRAVTASARAGAIYGQPTVFAVDDEWLYLVAKSGRGTKLHRSQVWNARLSRGIWRIKTRRLSVLFVPAEAVIPGHSQELAEIARS